MEARSEDQVEEIASDSHLKEQQKGSERLGWFALFEDPSESSESRCGLWRQCQKSRPSSKTL